MNKNPHTEGGSEAASKAPQPQVESKNFTQIAVVVEYDEQKKLFNLIKKPYKHGEEKIICTCKRMTDGKMAVESAHIAVNKGNNYAHIETGKIRFDWTDGDEFFDVFLSYAKILPDVPLSGSDEFKVIQMTYDSVMESKITTPLTKKCVDIIYKKYINLN